MKPKYRPLILALLFSILLLWLSLPPALAGEIRGDRVIHIRADEVVDDDLLVAGEEIIIEGVIKGDLMAAGRIIKVNGQVEGDLLAGAQIVIINGEVGDDVRAGGMVIVINGLVGDDVLAGGMALESGPNSSIGGDVIVGSSQALVGGQVGGDVIAGVGGLKIAGTVDGNVEASIESGTGPGPSPVTFISNMPNVPPLQPVSMGLSLGEGASVAGDINYKGSAPVKNLNEGAVGGEVEFSPVVATQTDTDAGPGIWLLNQVQRLLRLSLFAGLVLWLMPGLLEAARDKVQQKPWPSVGWGLLTPLLFGIGLGLLGLLAFLVDLPVLVLGTFIFSYLLVLFYLGAVVVGRWLGGHLLARSMPRRADSILWTTLSGLAIIWVLTAIPILGLLIGFVVSMLGVGGLWLVSLERLKSRSGAATAAS